MGAPPEGHVGRALVEEDGPVDCACADGVVDVVVHLDRGQVEADGDGEGEQDPGGHQGVGKDGGAHAGLDHVLGEDV